MRNRERNIRNLRWIQRLAITLIIGMLAFFIPARPASAATVSLNYSKVWLETDTNMTLSISGTTSAKWSITSGSDYISLTSATGSSVTVNAKAAGTAKVKAKVGSKSYTCTVKVVKADAEDQIHSDGLTWYIKANHKLVDSDGNVVAKNVWQADGGTSEFWILKVDRSLWYYRQTGATSYLKVKVLTQVQELPENLCDVASSYSKAYVLRTDGHLYKLTAKRNSMNDITGWSAKDYISDVAGVWLGYGDAAGTPNVIILKESGNLYGFGGNDHGEIGVGTTEKVTSRTKIMSGVTKFWMVDGAWGMTASQVCFALKSDGTLYAWGYNHGEIPDESYGEVTSPVKIGYDMGAVKTINSDGGVITMINSGKELWVWGRHYLYSDPEQMKGYYASFSPQKVASKVLCADADDFSIYYVTTSNVLYGIDHSDESNWSERMDSPTKLKSGIRSVKMSAQDGYALSTKGVLYRYYTTDEGTFERQTIRSGM